MARRLYGIVWRWHFVLGLLAVPIVCVIALTGAIYAFEPELAPLADERIVVDPARRECFTVDAAIAMARGPGCIPEGVSMPSRRDRAWTVWCQEGKERARLIDPGRGVVIGERGARSWLDVVYDLHWELLAGDTGRRIIEWGTSCTAVVLLSGVVLWWPRGKRRGGGVWWPRRRVRSRSLLRDVHAVAGIYVLPVLIAMAATGLMWTIHAGQRWSDLAAADGAPPPKSAPTGRAPIPLAEALARAGYDGSQAVYLPVPPADGDATAAIYLYLYDDTYETPWTAESVFVDAYRGDVLARRGFEEQSTAGKIDSFRYSLHVGAVLSLPGRIGASIAALVLAALCITGPWMWWKRRTPGTLGAPPRAERIAWGWWLVLVGFGWVMPAFGATLAVIAVFEIGYELGHRWAMRRS